MFGRSKPEKVTHETLAVKHKKTSKGCIVWLICTCGRDHAYGPSPDSEGDHTSTLAKMD